MSYDEELPERVFSDVPMPRKANGALDLKAIKQYRRETGVDLKQSDANVISPTQFQWELTRFLNSMIEGAGVLEAYHMTPDGRPWREQPRWRRQLWMAYQSGSHEKYV